MLPRIATRMLLWTSFVALLTSCSENNTKAPVDEKDSQTTTLPTLALETKKQRGLAIFEKYIKNSIQKAIKTDMEKILAENPEESEDNWENDDRDESETNNKRRSDIGLFGYFNDDDRSLRQILRHPKCRDVIKVAIWLMLFLLQNAACFGAEQWFYSNRSSRVERYSFEIHSELVFLALIRMAAQMFTSMVFAILENIIIAYSILKIAAKRSRKIYANNPGARKIYKLMQPNIFKMSSKFLKNIKNSDKETISKSPVQLLKEKSMVPLKISKMAIKFKATARVCRWFYDCLITHPKKYLGAYFFESLGLFVANMVCTYIKPLDNSVVKVLLGEIVAFLFKQIFNITVTKCERKCHRGMIEDPESHTFEKKPTLRYGLTLTKVMKTELGLEIQSFRRFKTYPPVLYRKQTTKMEKKKSLKKKNTMKRFQTTHYEVNSDSDD